MSRGTFAKLPAALLLAVAATGCSTIEGFFASSSNRGPAKVNDLVGAIEQVYVDSEVSKESVRGAVDRLQVLASADFKGDAVGAFAEFVESIELSEAQAEKLRDSMDDMKAAAEPVFEKWQRDLKEIASVELRQRSRNRMLATRDRYDAVVAAVEPALEKYDSINVDLRDHEKFLSHDLNPAALSAIQADVAVLVESVTDLDARLDASLIAARAYVDAASLPVTAVSASEEELERAEVEKVGGTRRK